jgi:uncharacterized protein (DUF488 family)
MTNQPTRKPRLFTIGHSDLTIEQFLTVLERSSIRLVADVRSNPASARFPHFERAALSAELGKRGLAYRWFRELGGRQPPSRHEVEHTALADPDFRRYAAHMNKGKFQDAAQELLGLAASAITAVMCAERDFQQCHRQFLSDKLMVMGARVVHILDGETAVEHTLHPDLVIEENKLIYKKKQLELLR